MLLLYVKYSFLLWVMIGSGSEERKLVRQLSEDETLLKVAACSQSCPDKVNSLISITFTTIYICMSNSRDLKNASTFVATEIRVI